jgi:membrane protein YdbS with pleckstrin-like domain
LHAQLKAQEGLEQSADRIAALIDLQISDLVARERTVLARVYEWNTFAGAMISSVIIGSPMYWLIMHRSWWTTTLLVIDGFFILLFIAVGISSVRKSSGQSEKESIGPPEERIVTTREMITE